MCGEPGGCTHIPMEPSDHFYTQRTGFSLAQNLQLPTSQSGGFWRPKHRTNRGPQSNDLDFLVARACISLRISSTVFLTVTEDMRDCMSVSPVCDSSCRTLLCIRLVDRVRFLVHISSYLQLSPFAAQPRGFFMPLHSLLLKLHSLDRFSPGFPDKLSNVLYGEEYVQCVSSLQSDDLVQLVDYLNGVRATSPFLIPRLSHHRLLTSLILPVPPLPVSPFESVYANSGAYVAQG